MSNAVVLKDVIKGYTQDQDKMIAPEETVQRFRKRLETLDLDILDSVVRIDNGRLNIPVFVSYCGRDASVLTGTKKQMGKGATPEQAEASAVMELTERFSFFNFANNPGNFTVATLRDLKEEALPFELIARSVHDTSADLDLSRQIFEDLPLKWTRAYNLTQERQMLVPFDWFYAINEFNGPSAGNCVEEALVQGICEVIERHTSSIISRQQLQTAAIDPDTAGDPKVIEMLAKYRQAGIKLYVTDFTLDMGIPSVGVLAYDPSTFPHQSEIVWTAGTTPDPEKAFSRALTEVAQLGGDFNSGSNYVASGLPKFTDLKQADFVMQSDRSVAIGDLPDLSNQNIRLEVLNCIQALSDRQLQVLVIDTMHRQLQIPAFYTIIPGAHFRERTQVNSVAMFAAKLVTGNHPPGQALAKLQTMDHVLSGKFYLQFYMGTCHLEMQDTDQALQHFNRALELQPDASELPTIYSYMGVCYKENGQYKEALKILEMAAAHDRERTDVYNLMGFCHFKLKAYREAIACFEKVLALDPTSAIDYANIASNYRDLGDTDAAIRYYIMALELDPGIEFARQNLEKLQS